MNDAPEQPWPPAKSSFFAALGVPASWVFAVVNLVRRDPHPGQRPWLFALLALAVLDVLVVWSAVIVTRNAKELSASLKPPPAKSIIGVVVDEDPLPEGLKVAEVTAGGPAFHANIAVGDVIDTCDGAKVRSRYELRACVGKHDPKDRVHLRVLRGADVREKVEVRTVSAAELRSSLVTPLPLKDSCAAKPKPPGAGPLVAWGLFVALGVFTWARRGGPSVLILAVGIAAIALLGTYSTSALCLAGVPETVRDLVELPLSPLSLFFLAWAVNRYALKNESPAILSGRRDWWLTAALAGWTHLLLMLRLALVIGAVMIVFKTGPLLPAPVEDMIREGAQSSAMKILFFITAAFFAPVAEEYFFRGVATTGLLRVMRPLFAIFGIALVFGLLHGGYGPRTPIVVSLGAILGWARWESRGLKAPIALHFAQNAVVSVIFLMRG